MVDAAAGLILGPFFGVQHLGAPSCVQFMRSSRAGDAPALNKLDYACSVTLVSWSQRLHSNERAELKKNWCWLAESALQTFSSAAVVLIRPRRSKRYHLPLRC
jgi:hypothetical protein